MKSTTKQYKENWNNIFSEEAKIRQYEIEKQLLEKEQQFRQQLEKKEILDKKKEEKLLIKNKIKKLL